MRSIVASLALLFTINAQASKPEAYDLKMELSSGGKVISSSKIILKDGEIGALVTESMNAKTYFDITASRRKINGVNKILMEFEIAHVQKDGSKTLVISPTVLAKVGKQTLIKLNNEGTDLSLRVIATKKSF